MNQEQKQFYDDNGYLIFDTGICHTILDKIVKSLVFSDKITRIQDAWTYNADVKSLALYPSIIETIQYLYSKNPLPFQTLNFNIGTSQPVHSDTIHFNTEPKGNMCGVWIALEDITPYNGPLFYYPKSHKEPELTYKDFGILKPGKDQYYIYESKLQDYINSKGYSKELGIIKKGQAILWAANLLHGGFEIQDKNSTRYSQVTHYFFESSYYYTPLSSREDSIFYRNPVWIK